MFRLSRAEKDKKNPQCVCPLVLIPPKRKKSMSSKKFSISFSKQLRTHGTCHEDFFPGHGQYSHSHFDTALPPHYWYDLLFVDHEQ